MKKLLYTLLLVVPILVYAQSSSENYVVTKTYKEARTTPVVGHNKDQVMTTVQYFDGLGRLKQTIGVEAGGNTISNNRIPIDWASGNTGSTDFFNKNGSDSENRIISGTTPFGGTDLLWECKPDAANNADGGWNTDYFTIDNTKTYRYTIWVKKNKVGTTAQGRTYHGTRNVNNLNGTPNTNPYFKRILLPKANTWYLLVGVVHPHTYTSIIDTGVSGVYDTQGNKVSDGTEFKWQPNVTTTQLRSYLFFTTDTSVRQYFWSPLFQEIDGSEIPLNEVVNKATTLVSEENIKDIISHVEYDELGRQTKEYLPFTGVTNNGNIKTGNIALETQNYYHQKYTKDFAGVNLPGEVNAYSEKQFDNSPLNRIEKQAAPGKDWELGSGHEIKFQYQTNGSREVREYYVTTSFADNTYTPTLKLNVSSSNNLGYYNANELYKTVTKDENWKVDQIHDKDHTTEEFKNKQGQVVLKRTYNQNQAHDTYYVYDDFGNLTYVIPPKAEGTTVKPTNTKLNELCYQYKYDYRNRLVEKKIPGKGWEYIVYDKLDRPVLTQDANLKAQNEWLITKYDQLGRVAYTGYRTISSSRVSLQKSANHPTTYIQWENRQVAARNIGGAKIYYTSRSIPQGVSRIYTVNYYDTYIDLPEGIEERITTSYGQRSTERTKGLATVSKVRVLGTSNWITTVTYYDEKARPIYIYSKNDELGTVDIIESKLHNLTGKVLETRATHKKTGKADVVTIDRFEYDHMDRLVSQNQEINSQLSERVVKNNYDDLGQLESKLIGNGTQIGYKDVTNGIAVSNNEITKTGSIGWSHGLATQGSINGDGYVEYNLPQTNKAVMIGLSNTNTNASYTTIDFALYTRHDGYIWIRESGVNKGKIISYSANDVFRVERIGNTIYYKKNNITFYTSETKSSGSLLGDISMYHTGAKIKDFKIVDNSKGLQKVDYDYNIRGWLTNLNEDVLNDNDLFNFTIKYNDTDVELNKRLYNGNISQTSWRTENVDKSTKIYNYRYDALNRITHAGGLTNRYNAAYSYDKNGNIRSLIRKGHTNATATSFGTMDDLSYTYDSGNKLRKVVETTGASTGFKDGSNTNDDYVYDVNGNMTVDRNKGITAITYNHLNLPTQVTINGKNIDYKYDAAGMKLSKTVEGVTTQYAGGYIYENDVLQFFNHPEGYVKPDNTGKFDYVYQYKDHLGNVRLSYTDNDKDGVIDAATEIIEESNYYPFGLKHKGYNNVVSAHGNSTAQKWNFLGQETNEELGLNWLTFRYRNYDASTGRFFGVDPVSEDYVNISTYQFAHNNPVWKIELEGLEGVSTTEPDYMQGLGYGISDANGGGRSHTGNYKPGIISRTLDAVGNFFGAVHNSISSTVSSGISSLMGTSEPNTTMSNSEFGTAIVSGDENAVYSGLESDASAIYNAAPDVIGSFTATAVMSAAAELTTPVRASSVKAPKKGGRLGNSATRKQNYQIATELEKRGYEITGGGGRLKEEYLKPLGGGRKGGSYPDITATKNGRTLRVNTVDVKKSGAMTKREATNAARIRAQKPNDHLLIIPKKQ